MKIEYILKNRLHETVDTFTDYDAASKAMDEANDTKGRGHYIQYNKAAIEEYNQRKAAAAPERKQRSELDSVGINNHTYLNPHFRPGIEKPISPQAIDRIAADLRAIDEESEDVQLSA